jgi:hypothetical protein
MTSGFGQQALHFVINEANIASGEEVNTEAKKGQTDS